MEGLSNVLAGSAPPWKNRIVHTCVCASLCTVWMCGALLSHLWEKTRGEFKQSSWTLFLWWVSKGWEDPAGTRACMCVRVCVCGFGCFTEAATRLNNYSSKCSLSGQKKHRILNLKSWICLVFLIIDFISNLQFKMTSPQTWAVIGWLGSGYPLKSQRLVCRQTAREGQPFMNGRIFLWLMSEVIVRRPIIKICFGVPSSSWCEDSGQETRKGYQRQVRKNKQHSLKCPASSSLIHF